MFTKSPSPNLCLKLQPKKETHPAFLVRLIRKYSQEVLGEH